MGSADDITLALVKITVLVLLLLTLSFSIFDNTKTNVMYQGDYRFGITYKIYYARILNRRSDSEVGKIYEVIH